MNYFEFYPGDYLRDTTRLALVDHGAYLKLMLAYYGEEEPLPADYPGLYLIAGAHSGAEKESVRRVADKHFPVGSDGLRHNKRADEVIAQAQARMDAAPEKKANEAERQRRHRERRAELFELLREAGVVPPMKTKTAELEEMVTRIVTRDNVRDSERDERDTSRDNVTPVTRDITATRTQTPDPTLVLTPPDGGVVPSKPGTPPCPHSEIVALYHELLPELPAMRSWPEDRQAFLRTRWREDPKRQSLDWWRRFFGYVRRCPFLMGQSNSAGRDPFLADLEWLIRPKNFRKVVEGKYEAKVA